MYSDGRNYICGLILAGLGFLVELVIDGGYYSMIVLGYTFSWHLQAVRLNYDSYFEKEIQLLFNMEYLK